MITISDHSSSDGIASASLWYKTNLTDSYIELPMTNNNGDQWSTDIQALAKDCLLLHSR